MPNEVELKFDLERGDVALVREAPVLASARSEAREHETVYFDTARYTLRQAGYSLRIRRTGDRFVQALKHRNGGSVGLFVRGQRGERYAATANRLSAYEPDLGLALDASLRGYEGCCYLSNLPLPVTDPASWPQGYAWLEERERHYHRVLSEAMLRGENVPMVEALRVECAIASRLASNSHE